VEKCKNNEPRHNLKPFERYTCYRKNSLRTLLRHLFVCRGDRRREPEPDVFMVGRERDGLAVAFVKALSSTDTAGSGGGMVRSGWRSLASGMAGLSSLPSSLSSLSVVGTCASRLKAQCSTGPRLRPVLWQDGACQHGRRWREGGDQRRLPRVQRVT
jgi:hypothetical protein